MVTVPSLPSLGAGALVSSAQLSQIASVADFLCQGKPLAMTRASTTQSLTAGSRTTITFGTKVFDNDGMFNSGQTTRLTVQTNGWYNISYSIPISGSGQTTTDGGAFITTGSNNPSGSGVVEACWGGMNGNINPGTTYHTVHAIGVIPFYMYAGDWATIQIDAPTGSTNVTDASTDFWAFMCLEWVGA